jgi:hypothetical protein
LWFFFMTGINMHNEKECCKQRAFETLKSRICKTF